MKTVIVIPARLGSTRFPGKVIAPLLGKPIIQWVWEKARQVPEASRVLVAVDDARVAEVVASFGGEYVMTKPDHPSGTDRIAEAVQGIDADLIINVQGDEPMIPPAMISGLINLMESSNAPMGTVAVTAIRDEIKDNPNVVKVVISDHGEALYFSRAMIPFLRTGGTDMEVYRHWGIYAYRKETLKHFVSLPEGKLEKCEKLEQLRALENGIKIMVLRGGNVETIGIDTPEDLKNAELKIQNTP